MAIHFPNLPTGEVVTGAGIVLDLDVLLSVFYREHRQLILT